MPTQADIDKLVEAALYQYKTLPEHTTYDLDAALDPFRIPQPKDDIERLITVALEYIGDGNGARPVNYCDWKRLVDACKPFRERPLVFSHIVDPYDGAVADLTAERDRYREALQEILLEHDTWYIHEAAKKALGGDE